MRNGLLGLLIILSLTTPVLLSAMTVPVSGGGSALKTAWDAAHPGDILEIQDSATYGPSAAAWASSVTTHTGVVIRTLTGQTPTIQFNSFTGVSGNTNFQIGSNSGGRIKIELAAGCYFCFQINNTNSLETLFENLDIVGLDPDHSSGGTADIAVYVAAQAAGQRNVRINNCLIQDMRLGDGAVQLGERNGGVEGTASVNSLTITSCTFQSNTPSIITKIYNSHGATANSQLIMDNNRILDEKGAPMWLFGKALTTDVNHVYMESTSGVNILLGDSSYGTNSGGVLTMRNCATSGVGITIQHESNVNINHCDLISNANPIVNVDPTTTGGTIMIKNSNIVKNGGANKSFGGTGGSPAPTLISDYNNAPNGYSDSWSAGTHDIIPGVDPLYIAEGSDYRVNAPQLLNAGSDGRDIGSAFRAQSPPVVNAAKKWTIFN